MKKLIRSGFKLIYEKGEQDFFFLLVISTTTIVVTIRNGRMIIVGLDVYSYLDYQFVELV